MKCSSTANTNGTHKVALFIGHTRILKLSTNTVGSFTTDADTNSKHAADQRAAKIVVNYSALFGDEFLNTITRYSRLPVQALYSLSNCKDKFTPPLTNLLIH